MYYSMLIAFELFIVYTVQCMYMWLTVIVCVCVLCAISPAIIFLQVISSIECTVCELVVRYLDRFMEENSTEV